ncbi:MAG: hypothetical protein ABS52_12360 [Gemmatimonadetes bacterium SCN 70-22]|nr:MAG: hypothetical protein ABS52_12360 [Gemmatimonadetes bacterium SCN 70-22]
MRAVAAATRAMAGFALATLALAALAPAALALLATDAEAQPPLRLRGTVVRQTLDGVVPVAREPVTLHRVSAREAGAIDSAVTDARGRYAFRVSAPDSQAMYLVSAHYGGIAYFSAPVSAGATPGVMGDSSEIVVYDTTSADVRLQLRGRHFVVSSPSADGIRSVIDVLEIENDTVLTRVAGPSKRATYSLLLPDGARNVRASQGEMGEGSVDVRNGRADLYAPLSPGLRQLVLTYDLPPDVFPLAIPLERSVSVLEVLLEEPGATAAGAGLVSQGGVSVDGKTFTRFLGQDAKANAVVTLAVVGGGAGAPLPTWLVPLVLALVTLGAIVVLSRRASPGRRAPVRLAQRAGADARAGSGATNAHAEAALASVGGAASAGEVTRLTRQLAAVDTMLEPEGSVAPAARGELARYRAALKTQLVDALAHRSHDR